jgi:hypothetical protein
MDVWEGYVTAGLKKAAFINRSLKDVELSCILDDQASWSGPRRSHVVMQALSTKSKPPAFQKVEDWGTRNFKTI